MRRSILFIMVFLISAFLFAGIYSSAEDIDEDIPAVSSPVTDEEFPEEEEIEEYYEEDSIYQYSMMITSSGKNLLISGYTRSNTGVLKNIGIKKITVWHSIDKIHWETELTIPDKSAKISSGYYLNDYPVEVTGGYYYRVTCTHFARTGILPHEYQTAENTSNVIWVDADDVYSVNYSYGDKTVKTDHYSGFYLTYSPAAGIGFGSYAEYLRNKDAAYKTGLEKLSAGNIRYFTNYDFIYLTVTSKYSIDKICDIFVTSEKVTVTYINGSDYLQLTHYYYLDGQDTSNKPFALYGRKQNIGGTDYYLYRAPGGEARYYFSKYGRTFSAASSDNDLTIPRRYFSDPHFRDINGKIYYVNDKGKKESGWHSIGSHRYYFRWTDKAALCGKIKRIDGKRYVFDINGICTGVQK